MLTLENLDNQFCSDSLKAEIKKLLLLRESIQEITYNFSLSALEIHHINNHPKADFVRRDILETKKRACHAGIFSAAKNCIKETNLKDGLFGYKTEFKLLVVK